jgi:hypothetical protein
MKGTADFSRKKTEHSSGKPTKEKTERGVKNFKGYLRDALYRIHVYVQEADDKLGQFLDQDI